VKIGRPMDELSANWRALRPSAVLFDLDGTLLDTAADIALALNRAIGDFGWPPIPESVVRGMIGRGAPILIQRAAAASGRPLDESSHAAVIERFLHHYGALQDMDECSARPYPGAAESLHTLHLAGLRTAIVTNKQQRFALGLLARLGLSGDVDLVVGGDTCERRKPDPQPLLFACERLQVPASRVLMVGDSINDVLAARAAGMPIVCVPYGYNEGQDPRSLECDAMIGTLAELPALLLESTRPRAKP
jgi:phosphoglycolate phosphatase